jgi:hypothetical protein
LGIVYNIAVVDAGSLLAVLRQDGALIGSVDLAIDRIFTADIDPAPGCSPATSRAFRERLLGNLDNSEGIKPVLETFTKHRLKWAKPLDLRQFENMPS